jgi:hypothetical protein
VTAHTHIKQQAKLYSKYYNIHILGSNLEFPKFPMLSVSSFMKFLFYTVDHKLNHIFEGFIAHLYSVIFSCVLFVRHEHIGHSVFSGFTCRPASLLETNIVYGFLLMMFIVFKFMHHKRKPLAQTDVSNSVSVHRGFAWTFVMAYSTTEVGNSINKHLFLSKYYA